MAIPGDAHVAVLFEGSSHGDGGEALPVESGFPDHHGDHGVGVQTQLGLTSHGNLKQR